MSREEAKQLMQRLKEEAEQSGYTLHTDEELVLDLMDGLLTNQKRYGYWSCPCREAEGVRDRDVDIICPCDYRDPDLTEHGSCYCGLYVSAEIAGGKRPLKPILERRPLPEERVAASTSASGSGSNVFSDKSLPVWRCKVCGYLCARPQPPQKCPICKVDADRFLKFS